jgi:hypothetical protein
MALKKPAFETEPTNNGGDTAVAEAPAARETAPVQTPVNEPVNEPAPAAEQPVSQPQAASTATTTIAKAQATSVATLNEAAGDAKRFKREVEEMKGASDFSFGNYNVFKGNNGEIACTETKDSFGRWVKVRLMSWDEHTEVSPGETGASTKPFVAYSKDGKVIDSVIGEEQKAWVGKTVAEYVTYLRDVEDFSKTKSRRFIDTACAILGSDSGDGPIGQVVQITLSESSIPAFSKHQQSLADTARCVAMGLPGFALPEDPFTFHFIREVASKGDNSWTKLRIANVLPAKF